MAGRTRGGRRRSVSPCQREARHAVVKRSGVPTLCCMAIRAIRRRKCRPRCGVNWSCRLLPFCQMASGVAAIRRRNRQVVVVVDVARRAGNVGMTVGQQESRRSVVEIRCIPTLSGVTARAIHQSKSWPCRRMHRVICLLPSR